jgi:DNA-binding CsgD family transcriptional regulator
VNVHDATSADQQRADEEQLALLNHAERLSVVGSWEWTPGTGELLWSDNLFRLFGLEPASITPSLEYVLARVHPADTTRVDDALRLWAGRDNTNQFDYRSIRDDDVVRHFRATVAFVDDVDVRTPRLLGSLQDVTSQDSLSRKLAAHAAVSKALDEWQEFERGAVDLLAGVGIAMDLPFGALWLPEDASLKARVIWHVESASLARLADARRDWRPGRGSPSLGRAWESRQPVISSEPANSGTPQVSAALTDAGVSAVIAIPAVAVDETLAVLEFLSLEPIEPTDRLLRSLNGIGHEVGYFLGQRRGELLPPVLTGRELEVLQLAARALGTAAIAAEMNLSQATVKRHFENAYARLGVGDRAAAVAQAMRQGLIS